MFSTALRAALLAFAAIASVVSAAPGLTLKLTGADIIDSVEKFKVVVTLTNTGDESLKLLNDPRGALHPLPTNTFVITTSDGSSPRFTGVNVMYSLESAAKLLDMSVFTILAPGHSASIAHDLSSAYDFASTGYSTYTVDVSSAFHCVTASNQVSSLRATVSPHVATLVGGKLAIAPRRRPVRVAKRAQFTGCNATQQDALNAAASAAQNQTAGAVDYLLSNHTDISRYITWFGVYEAGRGDAVRSHFASMGSHQYASFTFDCTCTNASLIAIIYPDQFAVMHLCMEFWQQPASGMDSMAGALVHGASEFTVNGGAVDYVVGQENAQSLAQNDPDRAVFNAANHEYFAEAGG